MLYSRLAGSIGGVCSPRIGGAQFLTTFTFNRTAFFGAALTGPLTGAYCKLVGLELALKDHFRVPNGHDVPSMLHRLSLALAAAGAPPATTTALNGLIGQLRFALTGLNCQGPAGIAQSVPANSYPYMRYLRHVSDHWPAPNSSDAELGLLNTTLDALLGLLRHHNLIRL
jgi:hypothetical protein